MQNTPIACQMLLSNEDNTIIADETHLLNFEILHSPSKCSINVQPRLSFHKGIYEITVENRLDIGYYQLRISALPNEENELILGFISDVFEVIDCQNKDNFVHKPLLRNYRELLFQCASLVMLEEYGVTMGSHVWDSGYIVARYLTEVYGKMEGTIVELGAGCGILGLSLSKLFGENVKIILTDRSSQMDLIQQNIQLNNLQSNCCFSELDWTNHVHISNLRMHTNGAVDFIVAADVLYEEESIEPLVHLIRSLNPLKAVFLAQKARERSGLSLARCQSCLSEMNWDIVHESNDVRVWLITTK